MTPLPFTPRGSERYPLKVHASWRFGHQYLGFGEYLLNSSHDRQFPFLSGARHFLCREASPVASSQNPETRPSTPLPRPRKGSGRTPERSRQLAPRPPENLRLVGQLQNTLTLSRRCFSPPNRTSREHSQSVPGATLSAAF